MNVIEQKSKGLNILALLLVVSIVLNGVLVKNLYTKQGAVNYENQIATDQKEKEIVALENTIKELEDELSHATPENRETLSQTTLEKQSKYLNVADEFINSYLNYDSNSLNKRREQLLPITSEKIINVVAPEESDNENALSSDPTFTATVTKMTTYISRMTESENAIDVIADVSYQAKSTEGETTVNSLIKLTLQTDNQGIIKVIDYVYYPIN